MTMLPSNINSFQPKVWIFHSANCDFISVQMRSYYVFSQGGAPYLKLKVGLLSSTISPTAELQTYRLQINFATVTFPILFMHILHCFYMFPIRYSQQCFTFVSSLFTVFHHDFITFFQAFTVFTVFHQSPFFHQVFIRFSPGFNQVMYFTKFSPRF